VSLILLLALSLLVRTRLGDNANKLTAAAAVACIDDSVLLDDNDDDSDEEERDEVDNIELVLDIG
jgi:hypothetical protein